MKDFARRLWRELPMDWRRPLGQWANQVVLPARIASAPSAMEHPPIFDGRVDVVGLHAAPLGVGRAARLCLQELAASGVEAFAIDVTDTLGSPREAPESAAKGRPSSVTVAVLNPDALEQTLARGDRAPFLGRRIIGYWVWELATAPAWWRRAGRFVHDIWSPSRFSADAIAAACGRPVRVVPHPVGLDPPTLPQDGLQGARARLGLPADAFVAVSSFSATSSLARKNPEGAIAAFREAFHGDPNAILVLRVLDGTRYPRALAHLRAAVAKAGPSVRLIETPGLAALADLYAACDLYLSLHRAEGFGLNLAEALLADRCVMATAWSAPLEFLDADGACLVPATLTPVRDPQGIYPNSGAWAEPDLAFAVDRLRRLRAAPDLRRSLAARGRATVLHRLAGGQALQALTPPTGDAP